jgi:hypothetical protein
MNRYFEIHVAGRNGFSTFVRTEQLLPPVFEDKVLELAVAAEVIEPDDAKDVLGGAGHVEESTYEDLVERQFVWPEHIHAV